MPLVEFSEINLTPCPPNPPPPPPVFIQVGFFRYHKVTAWPKDLSFLQTACAGPKESCCNYLGDLFNFVIREEGNSHSLQVHNPEMLVLDVRIWVLGRGTRKPWVQGEFPPKVGLTLRLLGNARGPTAAINVNDLKLGVNVPLQTATHQSGEIHP